MKRSLCLAVLLWAAAPLFAQQAAPEIPFDSVPNLLKLPPDLYLGEASGVAVNSKGHIFVFSRGNSTGPAYAASAAQLLEFSPAHRRAEQHRQFDHGEPGTGRFAARSRREASRAVAPSRKATST